MGIVSDATSIATMNTEKVIKALLEEQRETNRLLRLLAGSMGVPADVVTPPRPEKRGLFGR